MKSRIQFDVVFDPETTEATFPKDFNRWPLVARLVLFHEITNMIADRLDDAI